MRRYSLICTLVSLSLLACKPGTVSRGPQPPAPEVRAAQPVAIPQAALPDGGKIPVYVRVREPRKTVERIGDWTSATQPTLTAQSLEQKIEEAGMPIGKFLPGANALVAFWPQPPEYKIGGILPLADGTELANLGMQTEAMAGDGLLFGADSTGEAMKQVKAMRDDLVKIQKSPMASDVELAVDVEGLWGVYGPLARMALAGAFSSMAQMQGQGEMPANMQAIVTAEANAFMDALDQMREMTLRTSFNRDALEFSLVMTPKANDGGTTLTKMLSGEPVAAPELTRYVSHNEIVSQITMRDLGAFMNFWYSYMGSVLKPAEMEEMKRQFADIDKIGAIHIANGISMSPNAAMQVEYVMVADHPDELLKIIRDKMAMVNSGPLHEFYRGLDMDVSVSSEPLKREYKGFTIQSWEFNMSAGSNARDIDRQMMAKMFPDKLPIEFAQVGNFVLAKLGGKIDSLVDQVLNPEGRAPSRAVATFPAGAVFYMDMDFVGYMHNVGKMIPNLPAMRLPASAPPIIAAGYHQQGKAYYILKVPREMVTAIGQPASEDEQPGQSE